MRRLTICVLIPALLAGCSGQGLRSVRSTSAGPDEFLIAPAKALEAPADYNTLPTPTPGQANLTDRSALQEGIVAFGGQPESPNAGIPASDGALVQHTARLGVSPGIRATLAEADAKFRTRKVRFTGLRIVPVDRYNQAYRKQTLNAQSEAARWRRAGVRTPSYPPSE